MLPEQKVSTLIVDDDPDVLEFMAHVLSSEDHAVRSAADGDEALREADSISPDVVFLDINIPKQDGWLVCSKLKLRPKAPPIVLITGLAEDNIDSFAGFVHADALLRKPFDRGDVLRVLSEVCPLARQG